MASSFKSTVKAQADNGSHAMQALHGMLCKEDKHNTRISYMNRRKNDTLYRKSSDNITLQKLLTQHAEDIMNGLEGAVLIENISPTCVEKLSTEWKIAPEFFAHHTYNPPRDRLWDRRSTKLRPDPDNFENLYGIYVLQGPSWQLDTLRAKSINYCNRHIFQNGSWPINISTNLSYCQVDSSLNLFLVDAPPQVPDSSSTPGKAPNAFSLRFPYARNRGGLLIPSPVAGNISFLNLLEMVFFDHPWHLDFMSLTNGICPGMPLLQLMSCSTTQTRLRTLAQEIEHISYSLIYRPELEITDRLHHLRHELSFLRTFLKEADNYEPDEVEEFYEKLKLDPPNPLQTGHRKLPRVRRGAMLREVAELSALIVETFDILIGTIAVLDSKESKKQTQESLKQTRQSILLTGLAVVYLPLSLATSIFGMNLKEIIGNGPKLWVFFLTTILLMLTTGLLLGGIFFRSVFKRSKPLASSAREKPAQ